MKITSHTGRDTTSHRVTSLDLARRAATLSVAGVLAGLALAPTAALADHPTSGGGGTATSTRDKWSDMYDVAQRKEAMARDRVANADQLSSDASESTTGYINPWSYRYDTDQSTEQVVRHRVPPAKARHDSVLQRNPALANIVVSVTRGAPATCYLPDTLDQWTRRLIAVQLCSKAHIVPAVFLARAADYEPAYKSVYSLSHL